MCEVLLSVHIIVEQSLAVACVNRLTGNYGTVPKSLVWQVQVNPPCIYVYASLFLTYFMTTQPEVSILFANNSFFFSAKYAIFHKCCCQSKG